MTWLFVVNVGANDADAPALRSPVFPDGTFEFLPIRDDPKFAASEEIPTYEDLPAWTGRTPSLAAFVAARVRAYRAHADPEFESFTYGDIRSSRAANLRFAERGDEIWFVARLWGHDEARWTGASDYYFIGYFTVERNEEVPYGTAPDDLQPELATRISRNAHYRRMLAGEQEWFRVITGEPLASRRFRKALLVTPEVAGLVYGGSYEPQTRRYLRDGMVLMNKNGRPRAFETFGSVTRAIQAFLRSDRDAEYLAELSALAHACGSVSRPPPAITLPGPS